MGLSTRRRSACIRKRRLVPAKKKPLFKYTPRHRWWWFNSAYFTSGVLHNLPVSKMTRHTKAEELLGWQKTVYHFKYSSMTQLVLAAHVLIVLAIIVSCYLSYQIGLYIGQKKEMGLNNEINSIGNKQPGRGTR